VLEAVHSRQFEGQGLQEPELSGNQFLSVQGVQMVAQNQMPWFISCRRLPAAQLVQVTRSLEMKVQLVQFAGHREHRLSIFHLP